MADKKELNPSPKFPDGEYPELSPNPKLENGLVDKTAEKPNGSESQLLKDRPFVFDGKVYVNGKFYINGSEISADLPPHTVADIGKVLGVDDNGDLEWRITDETLIINKEAVNNAFTVTVDEFTKSANKDDVLLNLKIGSSYYQLWKSTLDSNGVQFANDKYIAYFDRDGSVYSGRVEEISSGGGSSIDSDVTVEIETTDSDDYASRTNYAAPISLQDFIDNCEAGNVYTEGTIARITNLLSETTLRIILIGTNHEVLAYNDTTYAKTTWQFLDMPEHNVRLGLPFNVIDWVQGSGRAYLKQYLEGTNTAAMQLYPSNMDGLISAQGLLQACHVIFEELPDTLKRHIKTVRRYYYRKRNYMSVAAEGGTESNTGQMCQLASNVFHLAGTDLGTSGQSGEGSGSKYNYFNSAARRIRFYNGSAASWWTASPGTGDAYAWSYVYYSGSYDDHYTYLTFGVAPAFSI